MKSYAWFCIGIAIVVWGSAFALGISVLALSTIHAVIVANVAVTAVFVLMTVINLSRL